MRRVKLLLAMSAVLVAMLTVGSGSAMAQSFDNEGNVVNNDSFIVTGDEVFVDDEDEFFFGFDDFFFDDDFEDEFFFFGFDGFFFDDDFDDDDFDDGAILQESEQDADSGDVSREFAVS